jgi:hypothetical protein
MKVNSSEEGLIVNNLSLFVMELKMPSTEFYSKKSHYSFDDSKSFDE